MNTEIMEDKIIVQEDKRVLNKRQEFPDSVRNELMLRANLRCCNPKCRRLLVAVNKTTKDLVIIGEGAHIYPAKEKGPRYDIAHSDDKFIKSQQNGLWLCPTCHELIDKRTTVNDYPAKKLFLWKEESETDSIRYAAAGADSALDLRMHRLSGAGYADCAEPRRIHAGQV